MESHFPVSSDLAQNTHFRTKDDTFKSVNIEFCFQFGPDPIDWLQWSKTYFWDHIVRRNFPSKQRRKTIIIFLLRILLYISKDFLYLFFASRFIFL